MKAAIYLIVTLLLAAPAAAQFAEVGSLDFPTSARSEEAQRHFLRGVAILHSFGWKQAIEQFQAAQAIEPDFALAYWGETLSYNHPLFGGGLGLDEENPRAVLARLGPTPAARAAKAPTDRERGFLEAVEVLWSDEGTYNERRVGYMEAMERLYERYPDDDEVATFYALSMLSGSRALGDQSLRLEVRAGTIAMKVFNENRGHPGAVHYTIHAFDDPLHAPLALDAAHRYAEIAPAVSHARHMPTHIFIQHGMWDLVSHHNQSAHDAAIALWEPDDSVSAAVHSLDWGQYGDLQRGDYDKARVWIERLERLIADSDGQARAVSALPLVNARYVVETEQWRVEPITDDSSMHELLATGLSAVRSDDLATAHEAEADRSPSSRRCVCRTARLARSSRRTSCTARSCCSSGATTTPSRSSRPRCSACRTGCVRCSARPALPRPSGIAPPPASATRRSPTSGLARTTIRATPRRASSSPRRTATDVARSPSRLAVTGS